MSTSTGSPTPRPENQDAEGSSSELARRKVENAIYEGRLNPGQRVTEAQIAAAVGVSRTPVREAMRQLETQGLLRRHGRVTRVASPISFEEARVLYGLRPSLEGYLAAVAAELITSRELDSLERWQEEYAFALTHDTPDRRRRIESDTEFHATIYRASRSDLAVIVDVYWTRFMRESSRQSYVVVGDIYAGRHEALIEQHEAMIGALRARDAHLIRNLVVAHIDEMWESVLRIYAALPSRAQNSA
jgi:DNA-binding GntR family transcriptional regulator